MKTESIDWRFGRVEYTDTSEQAEQISTKWLQERNKHDSRFWKVQILPCLDKNLGLLMVQESRN